MTYPIYYAGVGSRETPPDILGLMRTIGCWWARKGLTLRSGGAEGATCHMWHCLDIDGYGYALPGYYLPGEWAYAWRREHNWVERQEFPDTPDISDRPASAFLGFFGEEYDKVVMAA